WMVLGLVGLVLLATLLVSMISPRVYESTASVIAPKEGGGQILGVLGGGLLQQLASTLPSMTPNRDLLMSVLKSRTMLQSVVDRFQLRERYRSRHLEDAVNRLRNATALTVSREGAIFVKVEDTNPAAAADIANFYILQLDRLITRYGIGEAGRQRRFLTDQLAQAKVGLD